MFKMLLKCLLIAISFSLVCNESFGQVGRFRHKISQSDLRDFRLVGETTGNVYCIPNGTKVYITLASGKIYVDPWQITSAGVCTPGTQGNVSLTQTTERERLELKLYNRTTNRPMTFGTSIKYMTLPFGAWVYGLSAIPFRQRLRQAFDNSGQKIGTASSTNFALALYGGHTILGWSSLTNRAIHNNAISLVAFAGPSTVDLSREISAPVLPVKNKVHATIVYGLGATFSRNALGATLYLGWERAFGSGGDAWVYHGKPFIGFGVSTGFMR